MQHLAVVEDRLRVVPVVAAHALENRTRYVHHQCAEEVHRAQERHGEQVALLEQVERRVEPDRAHKHELHDRDHV